MRRIDRLMWAATAALVMAVGVPAYATGRLVYLGQDPSCHYSGGGQETALTVNAIQWAGLNADPVIVAVDVSTCNIAGLMATTGFSSVTVVSAANLPSTNLSGVQVIYVGAFFNASSVSGFASTIKNFVANGGGLVVEGSQDDWSAYPGGIQVGPANLYSDCDLVTIVNPGHPVMTGLTDVGLSNWHCSIHQDFTTPGTVGFVTLTRDDSGTAVDIVHDGPLILPAPAPALSGTMTVALALCLLGTGFYALRRRTHRSDS